MEWKNVKAGLHTVADRSTEPASAVDPALALLLAAAGLTLVLWSKSWRPLRNTVTLVHELGHAFAGASVGRRLSGIRIHGDTSGDTTTYGRAGFWGWVTAKYTAAAGYPAPALVGATLLLFVNLQYPRLAFSGIFLFLLICLPFIRSVRGFTVLISHLLLSAAAVWWAPDMALQALLTGVGFFLVAGGTRSLLELWTAHRRGEGKDSDIYYLSFGVRVFELAWFAVYFLLSGLLVVASVWLIFVEGRGWQ